MWRRERAMQARDYAPAQLMLVGARTDLERGFANRRPKIANRWRESISASGGKI
jgi:hypothetical protein